MPDQLMSDFGVSALGGPGTLFLILLALAVDAAAGHWITRALPDPAAWSRRRCAAFDQRMNRESRGDNARLARGLVLVLALAAAGAAIGLGVEWLAGKYRGGWLLELAALLATMRARATWERARGLSRALSERGLAPAQELAAPLTRRHAWSLDAHGINRLAVETLARGFIRRTVTPVFWYVLLGVPGVLVVAMVEGADTAVGSPGVRHERFGMTAARLDDALNALPARLGALLLALAAPFMTGARVGGAFKTMGGDSRKSASLNMGWPLAAMAGALDLALAGPHRDGGVVVNEPWVGSGRARVTAQDVDRAAALTVIAALLLALLLGLLLVGVAAI